MCSYLYLRFSTVSTVANLKQASNWYRDTCFMMYNVTWYVFMFLKIHYKLPFHSLPPRNIWIFQQCCLLRFPPQRVQSKPRTCQEPQLQGRATTPHLLGPESCLPWIQTFFLYETGKSVKKRGSVLGNVLIPFLTVSSPTDRNWISSYKHNRKLHSAPISPRHMRHFQVKQVISVKQDIHVGMWGDPSEGNGGFCRCD